MVANSTNINDRFIPPPEPLLSGRWRLIKFTRKDAEALVQQGIIPEDASTELLNGMIVLKDRSARDQDPTMIGPDHRKSVERLSALRKMIDNERRHVESQQPLVCSDIDQPDPDFMVLKGTLDDYKDLPTASDAFCVIEVADSSYERDSGEKRTAYARAGIGQYIILNLRSRAAEVYGDPDRASGTYPSPMVFGASDVMSISLGNGAFFKVLVGEILP